MANGLAGAHGDKLKDKQLLVLRAELRSYRLNGSGMNKIVRSRSATPCGIRGATYEIDSLGLYHAYLELTDSRMEVTFT